MTNLTSTTRYMDQRIDKIIKKAKCIKNFIGDNDNINRLITSLESYKENIGELPEEKMFYIGYKPYVTGEHFHGNTMMSNHISKSGDSFKVIGIKAVEFTSHIRKTVLSDMNLNRVWICSLPPEITGGHIADAVFDVQNFKISDITLMNMLIDHGFRPKVKNPDFIGQFD